jgi:enamine deaminase RidA (YjgF/YER057c/UK114 family)
MKTARTVIVSTIAACLFLCLPAAAQTPSSPEARLKALNITLPPDAAPAANFVNSVQSGKLLFLAGNTGGAAWAGKGSADGFGDQPQVINAFSDLMVDVFGEAGKHARSAVGMAGLPGNTPVEVEMIVEVE